MMLGEFDAGGNDVGERDVWSGVGGNDARGKEH